MISAVIELTESIFYVILTLKLPDKLQPYGLYVYYGVHICDFGMLRVNDLTYIKPCIQIQNGSGGHFEYISGD